VSHYYNEHNVYRAAVLRERMAEGLLPKGVVDERDIEIVPDEDFLGYTQIHLFAGIGGFPLGLRLAGFPEDRRIVTGGFPCQDISNAGKRAGITGARSRLWREMVRCIRVVRPELVFVENVAALLCRGMGEVRRPGRDRL
jgi:DNA (cytosine-5)-methyltransferase 1